MVLSEDDKAHNRLISRVRVVIEQVISGVNRNTVQWTCQMKSLQSE
jgi:hypothetical protein